MSSVAAQESVCLIPGAKDALPGSAGGRQEMGHEPVANIIDVHFVGNMR